MAQSSFAWRSVARHLLTITAIAGFAVLGAGTSSPEGASSTESASGDNAQAGPSSAARLDLERHFLAGRAYGDGPGGAEIAAAMRELLDPGMGDTLVVRVVPGEPKTIVALLRLRDLRDFSDEMREEWLDSFGETIRSELGETDANIVVGIRGSFFYGAVATMRPGAPDWRVDTGSMVSTNPIDFALSPPPPEPAAPAPAAEPAAEAPVVGS